MQFLLVFRFGYFNYTAQFIKTPICYCQKSMSMIACKVCARIKQK